MESLKNANFEHVVCPFGIIIGGTISFPKNNLHYVANVVAATCSTVSSQQTQAHTVADLLRNAVYVNAHQFDRHSP